MEDWPVGVFTGIDTGFGVNMGGHDFGIPTIQFEIAQSPDGRRRKRGMPRGCAANCWISWCSDLLRLSINRLTSLWRIQPTSSATRRPSSGS